MKYADLITVPTSDEIYARMKETARVRGADPDSWSVVSIPAIVLYVVAVLLVSLYELQAYFAKGAKFDDATDPELADMFGQSQFFLTRNPATCTQLTKVVTNTSENIYELAAGDLILRTSAGKRFVLFGALIIPPGTVVGHFLAEEAGLAGNVDPSNVSILETPLTGVSVSAGEIETPGTDEETVGEYATRCQALFDGLGAGHSGFVAALARGMDSTLTKVKTRVTGQGTMSVYLGTVAGAASEQQVIDFQELIDALDIFQAVTVTVTAAVVQNVTISATVTTLPGEGAAVTAAIALAIAKWQALVGYGDTIRESDYWRKSLGFDVQQQRIVGIFGDERIDTVIFDVDSSLTVDAWKLTVFQNDITVVDPEEV